MAKSRFTQEIEDPTTGESITVEGDNQQELDARLDALIAERFPLVDGDPSQPA